MKKPTIKQLIKRFSFEAELVDKWEHIAPRYGEKNTAEIKEYLPADPFLLYDYECLMLIYEEGKSKEDAVAIADGLKPDDWYKVWFELKKTLDNARRAFDERKTKNGS